MEIYYIKKYVLCSSIIGIGMWIGLSVVRLARKKRSEHFMWHVLPILTPSVAFLLSKIIAPWVESTGKNIIFSLGDMLFA